MTKESSSVSQKEREVVLARLEVLPPELYFSSGEARGSLSRNEMIERVKAKDDVGDDFVATEFAFLRAQKDGTLAALVREQSGS